jgi:UTP--glucose-1-phosphate uridylyltransferase
MADAVSLARGFVDDEPFVLALGDTIISSGQGPTMLSRLVQKHLEVHPMATIAAKRVSGRDVSLYGVLDVEPMGDSSYNIKNIVEKPTPEKAPSNLTISARYVIEPGIFEAMEETPSNRGEKLFTDCLMTLSRKGPVIAVENRPTDIVFDIGSPALYAKAFVTFALKDPGMAEAMKSLLSQLLDEE